MSMTLTGAHGVAESRFDPGVQEAHDDADLVLCDGTPPYLAAVIRGYADSVDRIPGLVAMFDISLASAELGIAQAFVGGPPGLAKKACRGLAEAIGRPIDGFTWSPPFADVIDSAYAEDVAERLRALPRPAVVWIGLSTPKQEVLVAHLKRLLPDGFFFVAVGAAFDIYAGTLVRPPAFMSRLGLAWLHRCIQEPRRVSARYARAFPVVAHALVLATWDRLLGR